jgi:hypothetical protein
MGTGYYSAHSSLSPETHDSFRQERKSARALGLVRKGEIPFWNVPYRQNLFFTGREDLLEQLHANLSAQKTAAVTQPQALSGLGGVGKTQTATEFAYRYGHEYHTVVC